MDLLSNRNKVHSAHRLKCDLRDKIMVKTNPQEVNVSSNPATTLPESRNSKNKNHESAKPKNLSMANRTKITSKSVTKDDGVAKNPGESSCKSENVIAGEVKNEDAQITIKQLKAKNEELERINTEILAEYASFVLDVNSCFAEACKKVEEKSKLLIHKYLNHDYAAAKPITVPVNAVSVQKLEKLEKKAKKSQDSAKPQQSTEEQSMKSDVTAVSDVSATKIQFKVEDRHVSNKNKKTGKAKASTKTVNPKPLESAVVLVEKTAASVEKNNEARISEVSDEDLSPPELAAKLTREYTNLLKLSC